MAQQTNLQVSDISLLFEHELEPMYPVVEIKHFVSMAMEAVMGFSRVDVLLRTDELVSDEHLKTLRSIVERLKRYEPIQYILGKVVFYGLPLQVNSDVLIPRPETEELIKWVLDHNSGSDMSVMDVCTGSGCIALALKSNLENAIVYGVDKSVQALNVATQNAKDNQLDVEFFHFDVLNQQSFGFMEFDLMVSNPPYVTESDRMRMQPNVLDHEPHMALFVYDSDPLLFYRIIVELAEGHLKKGGQLYFEINEAYGADVLQLMIDHNYKECKLKQDLNGRDRMIRGVKG